VRELMEDFYKKFLQKVATARKMTPEQVDKLAQGRVWTGAQAKANGLVDELGGIERALEMVKKEAGIGPSEEVVVVEYPRPKRLLDIILERTRSSARALTTTPLDAARGQLEQIEHFTRTSAWARMPAEIAIH
jgi:protease-4